MGKGDIKSRKGKITRGSYGVSRKRKREQNVHREFLENVETTGRGDADDAVKAAKKTETATAKKPAAKKTSAKKTTAKKTSAKEAPKEKTAVPKKTTTAKKAKPKK